MEERVLWGRHGTQLCRGPQLLWLRRSGSPVVLGLGQIVELILPFPPEIQAARWSLSQAIGSSLCSIESPLTMGEVGGSTLAVGQANYSWKYSTLGPGKLPVSNQR